MSEIIKAAFRDGLIIGFLGGMLTAYFIVIILFLIQSGD